MKTWHSSTNFPYKIEKFNLLPIPFNERCRCFDEILYEAKHVPANSIIAISFTNNEINLMITRPCLRYSMETENEKLFPKTEKKSFFELYRAQNSV